MLNQFRILFCFIIVFQSTNLFSQNIISEKWYGGNYQDEGYEAVNMPDGGFLIAGIYNYGNYNDIYLIRTNSSGDTLWTRKFGGNSWDNGYSIAPTFNNNFIIGGRKFFTGSATSGDAYFLKVDSNGDFIWESNYGSSRKDGCTSIIQTSDSGYVFTGQYNYSDIWVLKTDSSGIQKWSKTYGAGGGNQIIETSDHNYLITGTIGNPNNMYIAKLNSSNGDTLWTTILGGSEMDRGYSICNSYNGGFLIVGLTKSYGAGGFDIYLAELTSEGDTLSTKTYGFGENETGYSISQVPDSCYLISASTNSIGAGSNDIYLVKLDQNLDTLWTETYGGINNDWPNQIFCSSDSNYIVIGSTESFGNGRNAYFLKIGENNLTGIDVSSEKYNKITTSYNLSQNYPNPFNPSTKISFNLPKSELVEIKLFNLGGQFIKTIFSGQKSSGSHELTINASNLASGVYFYKIAAGEFHQMKKMVLMR